MGEDWQCGRECLIGEGDTGLWEGRMEGKAWGLRGVEAMVSSNILVAKLTRSIITRDIGVLSMSGTNTAGPHCNGDGLLAG